MEPKEKLLAKGGHAGKNARYLGPEEVLGRQIRASDCQETKEDDEGGRRPSKMRQDEIARQLSEPGIGGVGERIGSLQRRQPYAENALARRLFGGKHEQTATQEDAGRQPQKHELQTHIRRFSED